MIFDDFHGFQASILVLFARSQFVGTMPVMLEVSCIISAAAGNWPDFFVILAMVLVNAALGFREEMKAKNALAELTNQMESSIPCASDKV
jgi:H+-transporting ATPase